MDINVETTITITECKRTTNTKNGGPRFMITDDKGRVRRTAPDSAGSYAIVDGRTGPANVSINDNGQITDLDYIPF